MDKLLDYVCDELDEIEHKIDENRKLTSSEILYADTLAHLKKNLLKAEEYGMSYDRDMSYARKRDSRGRYSRRYSMDNEEMADKLREMKDGATDDQKHIIDRWLKQIEK